jgi:hypothetical protein
MPSLMLSYRRAEINAFWTLGVTTFSVVVWQLAETFALPRAWAWGAGAAAAALLPGLVWTLWLETGIRAWNKLMRMSAAWLRNYVLTVSYYMVIAVVGRGTVPVDRVFSLDGRSQWLPRTAETPQSSNYSEQLQSYPAGLRESGARTKWAVCLLPVVWLLKVLKNETLESEPPSATYTLY